MSGGWGGAREGAGRKSADYEPSEERLDYERERADHERVKRMEREWKLAVAQGQYISRDDYRQAAVTAVAIFTQAARSIPDTLERVCNLTPEQAEQAERAIDAALADLAAAFKGLTKDA